MGTIREYGSRASIEPTSLGVSSLSRAADDQAQGGRRMGQLAAQTGNSFAELGRSIGEGIQTAGQAAEDYYSRKEVLKFGADSAAMTADLTSKWNTARNTADPNDPTVAQRFNADVLEPTLENFGKGYLTPTGQRMAVQKRQELLEHFAVRQEADDRIASSVAAEKNLTTIQNSNAASLAADPTGLDLANANVSQTISEYKKVGGLSAEQNAHLDDLEKDMLRTNTLAAFHGMASANPKAAEAALASGWGKENLKEQDQATLRSYAQEQQRFLDTQQRAAEAERIRLNKERVNTALGDLTSDVMRTDGSLAITPDFFAGLKKIAAMPDVEPGAVRSAYDWAKTELVRTEGREMQVMDPPTADDFQKRMVLSPDDPKALSLEEVFRARAENRLSKDEFAFYQDAVKSLSKDPTKRDAYGQFNKFLASQKSSISASNPLVGKVFPEQDRRFGQFQFDMRQQFDAAYKKGTWQALIDPSSPAFLGKQIAPYQTGNKEALQALRNTYKPDAGAPGATPPVQNDKARKAGETIEQYNKRMGGG